MPIATVSRLVVFGSKLARQAPFDSLARGRHERQGAFADDLVVVERLNRERSLSLPELGRPAAQPDLLARWDGRTVLDVDRASHNDCPSQGSSHRLSAGQL